METGLTKQRLIAELSKSPHGALKEYIPIGKQAVEQEGEFFAHLIAWDKKNGQIRDSKVALPVIGLAFEHDAELLDNAYAHLALLGPRELLRAFHFAREIRPTGQMVKLRTVIGDYLHEKEQDKGWDHLAIQHRKTLRELYARAHVRPMTKADRVRAVLFGEDEKGNKVPLPKGSIFEVVANLKNMAPTEAAGSIMKYRIPFLIAMGALGAKAKEPDLVLALIGAMSATELTTNVKMLEKLGLKTNPALRGAFDNALAKAATSKKNTLKTTKAAEQVEDEGIREKLQGLQDKQIANLGGPSGNWLVLSDCSSSMSLAIEASRHVAATLTKMCKGKVWLVFFNTTPMSVDVTGLPLDSITKATRHITASGATSIGCGLQRMLDEKVEVDGIAVVSDAAENTTPFFADVYGRYSKFVDKQVPVYLYRFPDQYRGHPSTRYLDNTMKAAGFDLQEFDLSGKVDYYSLPNLVATMRENRYSMIDEIMATPLLTLNSVLKSHGKVLATA